MSGWVRINGVGEMAGFAPVEMEAEEPSGPCDDTLHHYRLREGRRRLARAAKAIQSGCPRGRDAFNSTIGQ